MQLHSKTKREPQELLKMLEQALQRQRAWKPCGYRDNCKKGVEEIGSAERDLVVRWLAQLTRQFTFYPETFALSVAILDRFLHVVKARPKYLRCIGIACFYLASKTVEEDEVIPGTFDLVRESGCGCTVSEVLRMERCILDKLHWNIRYVTYLDFLHTLHALLLSKMPHLLDRFPHVTASRQLALLTEKLQTAASHHAFAAFRPAVLATAALSLELEQFHPDWFKLSIWCQALVQADSESLIRCRELMSAVLGGRGGPTIMARPNPYTTAPTSTPLALSSPSKATKRKMEDMEEDDIYEGIKRLYGEEEAVAGRTCCAIEARVDSCTTAPSRPLIAL